MPPTEAFKIRNARTGHTRDVAGIPEAQVAIAATATATPAPGDETPYISSMVTESVRAFVKYTGVVSSATVVLWVYQDGDWYRGGEMVLEPAKGNELRDITILGRHTQFGLQVAEISGGGTLEVRVLGVW